MKKVRNILIGAGILLAVLALVHLAISTNWTEIITKIHGR